MSVETLSPKRQKSEKEVAEQIQRISFNLLDRANKLSEQSRNKRFHAPSQGFISFERPSIDGSDRTVKIHVRDDVSENTIHIHKSVKNEVSGSRKALHVAAGPWGLSSEHDVDSAARISANVLGELRGEVAKREIHQASKDHASTKSLLKA